MGEVLLCLPDQTKLDGDARRYEVEAPVRAVTVDRRADPAVSAAQVPALLFYERQLQVGRSRPRLDRAGVERRRVRLPEVAPVGGRATVVEPRLGQEQDA